MKSLDYTNKVNQLNSKYPSVKAEMVYGWNNQLQIKVSSYEKAQILFEMFPTYIFTY